MTSDVFSWCLMMCLAATKMVTAAVPADDSSADRLSLLQFKAGIAADPTGKLSSWNDSFDFCRWEGVACARVAGRARVSALSLGSLRLAGQISASIANLSSLQRLILADNRLHGAIPDELGRLTQLTLLNLSSNSLTGEIPSKLSHCPELRYIALQKNQLTGEIPPALGSLSKLLVFNLAENQITGPIPPSLGNLSSSAFKALYLGSNRLTGAIPPELGRLAGLEHFEVHENGLAGGLPSSIYNLLHIKTFIVAINGISGTIPPDVGSALPNLRSFVVSGNQFEGAIPPSFSNASSLRELQLAGNKFSGRIPSTLRLLTQLDTFGVGDNRLEANDAAGWSFLSALSNCTSLRYLDVGKNTGLRGALPSSVANLSVTLERLALTRCNLSGGIPEGIANLAGLTTLLMGGNLFTGAIPAPLGRLPALATLELSVNGLSGEIPSSLGNLTGLSELYLGSNRLSGRLPSSFGNLQLLQKLDLSRNNLSGGLTEDIFGLSSLSLYLDLSHNSFTGALPAGVGHLRNLAELDLYANQLSGEIPNQLGDCQSLEYLAMDRNSFQGSIPASLGRLGGIQELDLSVNNLSGMIPETLGDLRYLWRLNLSFNDLEGEVPEKGVFINVSAMSLAGGNNKLCGGDYRLRLPPCAALVSREKRPAARRKLHLFLAIAAPFLALCLVVLLYIMTRKPKAARTEAAAAAAPSSSSSIDPKKVSYKELVEATDGFAPANLLGMGSCGSVYKATLHGGEPSTVAVKVFNLQMRGASRSFLAECEALRNVRHRNLVKIITSCSSVDEQGEEFKALVLEFMPNGSLHEWLHPGQQPGRVLDFAQRLNAAIDVAAALVYLHTECHSVVVHCDLKPSNVLLDEDMTAHVGDFGIARLLRDDDGETSAAGRTASTSGLKGTVGYAAPEYGLGGAASTQADAYSFGILLLEIFTAKRPTDPVFQDGVSIRSLVEAALPAGVLEIVDPRLPPLLSSGEFEGAPSQTAVECLVSVMKVGLLCSVGPPRERLGMGDVAQRLRAIRDAYLSGQH